MPSFGRGGSGERLQCKQVGDSRVRDRQIQLGRVCDGFTNHTCPWPRVWFGSGDQLLHPPAAGTSGFSAAYIFCFR